MAKAKKNDLQEQPERYRQVKLTVVADRAVT